MIDRSVEPRRRVGGRDHVDDTVWHSGLGQQLCDPECRQWCLGRRLDDDGVASSKGRRELAGDHCRREVPRRDDHDDTDGWMLHDDSVRPRWGGADRAANADRLFGVPPEELCGVCDFARCVGERFAVLSNDQVRQLGLVLHHQLVAATQDLGPFTRGALGPRRLSDVSCLTRRRRIDGGPRRDGCDDLLGPRVGHVERVAPGAISPLAADEQLGTHQGNVPPLTSCEIRTRQPRRQPLREPLGVPRRSQRGRSGPDTPTGQGARSASPVHRPSSRSP